MQFSEMSRDRECGAHALRHIESEVFDDDSEPDQFDRVDSKDYLTPHTNQNQQADQVMNNESNDFQKMLNIPKYGSDSMMEQAFDSHSVAEVQN